MTTKKPSDDVEKFDVYTPRDGYNIILVLFFFLGLVHFLPFSFFTTATEYWMYKFRNTSIEETNSESRTNLQAQFSAILKVSLQVSEITLLIVTLIFGHLVKVRVRKIGVLCTILALFLAVTAFVEIDTDSWQTLFFVVVMLIVAGINGTNAVFTITMYTVMASFPHEYLGSYLLGVGLSTIFSALLQIVSLTFGFSEQGSALFYFLAGDLVIVLTLVGLIVAGRNEFYSYYMSRVNESNEEKLSFSEGWRLMKKIWPSVVMGGFMVLTADAAPTALVVSEGEGGGAWSDTYFIPTITYLVANICGSTGRLLGLKFAPKISNLGWCLFAFTIFITFAPLFIMCNAQPRSNIPVVLPHDYQYIILIVSFNLLRGYMVTRSTYNIANLVTKEELKRAYHVNMLNVGLQTSLFALVNVLVVAVL